MKRDNWNIASDETVWQVIIVINYLLLDQWEFNTFFNSKHTDALFSKDYTELEFFVHFAVFFFKYGQDFNKFPIWIW